MSDAPQGPGWWMAGDGKWYPPPPAFSEPMPTRPPTPPPDQPPTTPRPTAYAPLVSIAPVAPSRRGRLVAIGVVALVLILAMLGLVVGLVSKHASSTTAAPDSREYRLVVTDIIDAETTNRVFILTFWEGYEQFVNAWNNTPPDTQASITAGWLDDARAQIAQFRLDLQDIDEALNAEKFSNGSIPDSVRDAAVAHYRAWQNWAADAPALTERWTGDQSSASSLDSYMDQQEPQLSTDINDSFRHLCTTLTSTEPTDGSYEETITSICSN